MEAAAIEMAGMEADKIGTNELEQLEHALLDNEMQEKVGREVATKEDLDKAMRELKHQLTVEIRGAVQALHDKIVPQLAEQSKTIVAMIEALDECTVNLEVQKSVAGSSPQNESPKPKGDLPPQQKVLELPRENGTAVVRNNGQIESKNGQVERRNGPAECNGQAERRSGQGECGGQIEYSGQIERKNGHIGCRNGQVECHGPVECKNGHGRGGWNGRGRSGPYWNGKPRFWKPQKRMNPVQRCHCWLCRSHNGYGGHRGGHRGGGRGGPGGGAATNGHLQ